MTPVVLDASIVLSWRLGDEHDALADVAMQRTIDAGGVVPGIWWYELRNALVVSERRGRTGPEDVRASLADLAEMRISSDTDHDGGAVLDLARRRGLSVYDAACLEVASRRALPIASLDRRLREAAADSRIDLLEANTA